MIRNVRHFVALAALLVIPAAFAADQSPPNLDRVMLKNYAQELQAAFPGQVDIYITGKDTNLASPSMGDCRIVGCASVAGALYYVCESSNRAQVFVAQSQVAMIRNKR
jgi:hypothetical protein